VFSLVYGMNNPLLWGGGGERGIIMPLGEEGGVWEAFGDKL
jgi:hypothetical protein